MKVICAWCGKHLSGKKNDPDVSHGICNSCKKKVEKEKDEYLKKK